MSIKAWRKWLRHTFGLSKSPPIRRPIALCLEWLEDRLVPTFTGLSNVNLSATEGTLFSGSVGAFTTNTPGDTFTATIAWGDGPPAPVRLPFWVATALSRAATPTATSSTACR